jgi:hypothetical protein
MTILSLVLCIIMKSLICLLVCKVCAKGYPISVFYFPNAFLKSINVQYNFLPKEKYNDIKACIMNILSVVGYPFLKPDWHREMISNSFDRKVSLLLIIEVNSFPEQLISSKKLNENDENDDEADTFLDNICDNMTIF